MKKNKDVLFKFMNLRGVENLNFDMREVLVLVDHTSVPALSEIKAIKNLLTESKTIQEENRLKELDDTYNGVFQSIKNSVSTYTFKSITDLKNTNLGKTIDTLNNLNRSLTIKDLKSIVYSFDKTEYTDFFNTWIHYILSHRILQYKYNLKEIQFLSRGLILGKILKDSQKDPQILNRSKMKKVNCNRLIFSQSIPSPINFRKNATGYLNQNQIKLKLQPIRQKKSGVMQKKEKRRKIIQYIDALKSAQKKLVIAKIQAQNQLNLKRSEFTTYISKLDSLQLGKSNNELEMKKSFFVNKLLETPIEIHKLIEIDNALIKYLRLMNSSKSETQINELKTDAMQIEKQLKNLTDNPVTDPFDTFEKEQLFLDNTGREIFETMIKDSSESEILNEKFIQTFNNPLFDISVYAGNFWDNIAIVDEIVNTLGTQANQLCEEIRNEMNNPVASTFGNIDERDPSPLDQPPIYKGCGIGDLVYVKEKLLEYEAREIAHIENVQGGEKYHREFSRETEETTVEETEVYTEKAVSHDLQTSDRFEMESKSQETISEDLTIDAGLNVSATYGMVSLDSSLNVGFGMSKSASNSKAMKIAQEVIDKTVEKTEESFKEKIAKILKEKITETTIHEMDYSQITTPYSCVFKWVEKSLEVELKHYGSRLMLEFYIPEPAMGILANIDTIHSDIPPPPPFDFSPNEIDENNYLCLAQIYQAVDIEPPPPEVVSVGYAWVSSPDEQADEYGEDTHSGYLQIPDLYEPYRYIVYSTALKGSETHSNAKFWLAVAIGGIKIFDGRYCATFSIDDYFNSDMRVPTESGLPITIRARGHYDKTSTVNIQIQCKRREDLLKKWKIDTYANLKEAYSVLVRDYEEKLAKAPAEIEGHHPDVNREIEKGELAKWCITSLRNTSINMDAIVKVKISEDTKIEIDPVQGDLDSEIVDFYESCFEWNEMTYLLYPYYWGRRELWDYKLAIRDSDPIHENFLKSGAAKVLVPVTPGMEEKVLYFINPENNGLDELTRIQWNVPKTYDELSGEIHISHMNIIDEVLLSRSIELARGIGTISVTHDSNQVTINTIEGAILNWELTEEDISRQIFIKGVSYTISGYIDQTHFLLERGYEGETNTAEEFLIGSIRLGEPWVEKIPTSMVILSTETAKLNN